MIITSNPILGGFYPDPDVIRVEDNYYMVPIELCLLAPLGSILGGDPIKVGNTKVYVTMESNLPDYDPFESLKKMVEHLHENGCDMLCAPETKNYLIRTGVMQINYDEL